jgi:RHS repeat-associated protein
LIDFPKQVETVGVQCGTPPVYPADFVSGIRYVYDDLAYGAAPTVGNITWSTEAASFSGQTPSYATMFRGGYDTYGRITSSKDALSRETLTAYTQNVAGLTVTEKETNPAGHVTTTTLDPAWGEPTKEVDENNKVTEASYDALGRLTKVWLPGRATNLTPNTEYTYSITKSGPSWVRTRVLGQNDSQMTASYQIFDGVLRARQEQTLTADGKRAVADTAYDGRGLTAKQSAFYNDASAPASTLLSFTDADVETQGRVTYDGLERPLTDQLWSLGAMKWQTTTSYDGDRVSVDPPAGGTATTEIFDGRGRTTTLRQYTGGAPTGSFDETTYGYDDADQLVRVTDPAGNDWTYSYDLLGRQTQVVDPDAGTATFTYNNADELLTSTDGRGEKLAYTYDDLGRLKTLRDDTSTGPVRASWTYDSVAKGTLTSATRVVGADSYTTTVNGYTDLYQPTGISVTIPPSQGTLAGTYTFGAGYKVDGSLGSVTYPAAGGLPAETINYAYSNLHPTTMIGANTYVASTAYHWDSRVAQRLLGATGKRIRVSSTLDPATRRLTKQQIDTENQTTPGSYDDRSTNEFGYDQLGNVTVVAGKTDGVRDQVECFSRDYLRRLTEAWTNASWNCSAGPQRTGADPYWRTWTYDTIGNRKTQIDHGPAGDTTSTYAHPNPGGTRPHTLSSVSHTGAVTGTDSFGYDNAGNTTSRTVDGITQTLTWDPEGHLADVTADGQAHTYIYDAFGTRLVATEPSGAATLYLGDTQLHRDSTGTVTATRHYRAGGDPIAVRTTNGGLYWLVADHHGTGQLAIDADTLEVTRRRVMPFGEPRGTPAGAWPDKKGFVGGDLDPTGLIHLGAREYDPTTGRFLSVDPLVDLADPQTLHGYAYANNSPTSFSDPDGLQWVPHAGGGGGVQPSFRFRFNLGGGAKARGSAPRAGRLRPTVRAARTGDLRMERDMRYYRTPKKAPRAAKPSPKPGTKTGKPGGGQVKPGGGKYKPSVHRGKRHGKPKAGAGGGGKKPPNTPKTRNKSEDGDSPDAESGNNRAVDARGQTQEEAAGSGGQGLLRRLWNRHKGGVEQGLYRANDAQDKFNTSVGRLSEQVPPPWDTRITAGGRLVAGMWGFARGYLQGRPPI